MEGARIIRTSALAGSICFVGSKVRFSLRGQRLNANWVEFSSIDLNCLKELDNGESPGSLNVTDLTVARRLTERPPTSTTPQNGTQARLVWTFFHP